jgi:uncharacterized protein YjiS (DUF1127 family)
MSILNLFTSAARVIAEHRRRERAYGELMALDDHALADIGVDRSEIGALAGGFRSPEADASPAAGGVDYWSAHTRLIGSPG